MMLNPFRRKAQNEDWNTLKTRFDTLIAKLDDKERWALHQALAGEGSFYGDGDTLASSQCLDVETFRGTVTAVWFRCLPIAFNQYERDGERATAMEAMYGKPEKNGGARLTGIEWRKED